MKFFRKSIFYKTLAISCIYFWSNAMSSTYPDCTMPDAEPSMGQCAYKQFKEDENKLAKEVQNLEQRLKVSPLAAKLLKLDQQDWDNYMELKCSNKEMGIEDAADGTDANSRAFCKISLMRLRARMLIEIK